MATATLVDDFVNALSPEETVALAYDWKTWRREKQALPDGAWNIWLIYAGRGWGKNRTAGETIREWVDSGTYSRLHLVARTAADVRDTMIDGEGGLLDVCSGSIHNRPTYTPSKRRVDWPNGARATLFSAEEPESLRGPQCDAWWADEVAAWKYPQKTWDNLQFGARLGSNVRGIVTTTPKPTSLIKALFAESQDGTGRIHYTAGTTYENADNLAENAMAALRAKYEGTRLGLQELHARILDDNPGALWKRDNIDAHRVTEAPDMLLVYVAIDPAVTANASSDETGIVAVGLGANGHIYVLADASLRDTPHNWATAAVSSFHKAQANMIAYESNQGGDMVAHTIATVDGRIPLRAVHASRGKHTRAEPIAALYEQGKVHHVGFFPEMEDQMCEWEPGSDSPDRMDALVWGCTAILTHGEYVEHGLGEFDSLAAYGGIGNIAGRAR